MTLSKWLGPAMIMALMLLAAGCASSPAAPAASTPAQSAATPTTARAPTDASTAPSAATASSTGSAASSGAIKLVVVPDKSEARYRVREQLASLSLPSDAIGRTHAITGTIVGNPDGSIVPSESKFVVDLSTLQSDRSQRDNFLRRAVLQTDQYQYATFVPTQAPGLPLTLPASGDVSFKLIGNLTIRDVTKPVTWTVTGHVQGNEATGTATTSFTFEYFNLNQPHVSVVLSIVDNITLEVDLDLQRVTG